MVQRLNDPTAGGPLESRQTGNSSLAWQEVQFPHQNSPKIGDVLLQFANGEIKVPVGLAFQHRRSYDVCSQEPELVPGSKRSRLVEASDISFKAPRQGPDGSIDGRSLQMLARTFTLSTAQTVHPLEEPSPLGLTLKKTPSLLDLVAMTVGQGGGNSNDLVLGDGGGEQGLASRAGLPTQGKLKASNFPASTLKIGNWERVSKYEGDVVAKCYYAKRKLVWEVLENGLKSKIELQWSDISAIKASYGDGQAGVLEVEVSRPPLFFKETNPQPRKHTLWEATSDFTGGEATICKRHVLQFPEGVLNKHYEKLLQCDPRLKSLATSTTMETSQEQIFHPGRKDQQQPEQQMPSQQQRQPALCSRVKTEVALPPLDNRCSPSSAVMESRGSDDSDGEEGQDTGFSPVVDEQQKTRGVVLVAGDLATSDKDVLNEIAQILLGSDPAATKTTAPENGGGLIRVSSMTGFLGEDGGPWMPTSYAVSDWSFGTHGNEEYGPEEDESSKRNNEVKIGDENIEDEKPKLLADGKRTSSASDLLVNLPRIASLPQLFQGRVL